jgi:LPXTG-motif cell wall-anchored protein
MMMRNWSVRVGVAAVAVLSTATIAFAGGPPAVAVPEISPTSISAGLAILGGGVLMFRARRKK